MAGARLGPPGSRTRPLAGRAGRSPPRAPGGRAPEDGSQGGGGPTLLGGQGWGGSGLLTLYPAVERTRIRKLPAPWGGSLSLCGWRLGPQTRGSGAQLRPAAVCAKLRSQTRAAPDPTLLIITNVPFAERDFIFAENSSEILISSHSAGPNR